MSKKEKRKANVEQLEKETKEAFRTLRTNLQLQHRTAKCITVSSCKVGEGKTYVAYGLAQAFAQAGCKVILVDADVHNTTMQSVLGLETTPNTLEQYLQGKKTEQECVISCGEHFDAICSGGTGEETQEELTQSAFGTLLETLKDAYDYVLIDTPAVETASDALVVAEKTDGLLWVARAKQMNHQEAKQMLQTIHQSGINLLGTVWNQW